MKTINELNAWMKENCIKFDNYSIGGNSILEGYGIEILVEGLYCWFYIERGNKNILEYFKSESDVVNFAYNFISKDKHAKSHLIFQTESEKEKDIFLNKLKNNNFDFWYDRIPYLNSCGYIFRVFVVSCRYKELQNFDFDFK